VTRHHPNRGATIATAVLAVGLAGTIIHPNGAVGVTLFGAAAALLYFLARPVARLAGAIGRPRARFSPTRIPAVVGPRKVAAMALASGALLGATNLFDENGDAALGRILNDATFLGGFMLIAAIALITLASVARWARTAYRAEPATGPTS
jgi:hypothetical protein